MFKTLLMVAVIVWGLVLLQGKGGSLFPSDFGSDVGSDFNEAPNTGQPASVDGAGNSGDGQSGYSPTIDGMRERVRDWVLNFRQSIEQNARDFGNKMRQSFHHS